MTSQWWASMSNPAAWVAPMDSSEQPKRPAARGPDGEIMAATATSGWGWEYGVRCSRAFDSENHSPS